MKKIYLFLLVLLSAVSHAQIVNIPDANLKAKLLAANVTNNTAQDINMNNIKIDVNSNNEIDVSEALSVYYLNLANPNQTANTISNSQGLNGFLNLKSLNLSYNSLTSFDATPFSNLATLIIIYNSLTTLNINNLQNLKYLNASYNGLTSFEATPFSNLVTLMITNNSLTTLNINNLQNLKTLWFSNNNLTNVDISNLPMVENITCIGNQLTSLNLNNKPFLQVLYCNNNNIANLNLSNLINLTNLNLNYNPISNIDLSGITKLTEFQSMYTNIQTVNVTNQYNLHTLLVGNNPSLQYVFMKNGSFETGLNFESVPNLKYICVDSNLTPELMNMQYIATLIGSGCVVGTYCTFSPGGISYIIQGNTKFDSDNNGCDINDLNSPLQKFNITNGTINGTLISNNSGNYYIPVQAGTHTISPVIENPSYFNISPATFTASFPSQTSPLTQNFCLTANGNHNDLEVIVIPVTPATPGFNAKYKILYKNKGTTTQSGSLVFNYNDNLMNFSTATVAPSSQSTGTLNWNFTNLLPFETREITTTFVLNTPIATPPLNGNDVLNFTSQINGLTDETPVDNTFTLNQTVVNSFDPNDKTCLQGTAITQTQVGDYVHYLIRFENTGTANAQNIVVKDEIDVTKFDINSIVALNGSHSFVTRITSPNVVEFIFENIQLPFNDATNDGFVSFKIRTKSTLNTGDSFSNSAKIYFDYNAPIVTNTYTTAVQAQLATVETATENFSIYPNPVKDFLHFKTTEKILKLEIFDVSGRVISSFGIKGNSADLSGLAKGHYIIKVYTKDRVIVKKLIKE